MLRRRSLTAVCAAGLLLAGCSTGGDDGAPPSPAPTTGGSSGTATTPAASTSAVPSASSPTTPATPTPSSTAAADARPTVTGVVADGLDVPWGIAFLPDGTALVSERDDARIVLVAPGGKVRRVGTVPGVDPGGEGGLLGLAVSPEFESDRLVFAYYTGARDNRVVRMTYRPDGRLGRPKVILDGIEKGTIHNGGRLGFGPDGYLYVSTGDASDRGLAQDKDSLNGKILRITADGKPAPGDPFPGSPVWSLGHRNVQGFGWDAEGRMWASEFGQNTYDELNLIEPGRNYGWPDVEGKGGGEKFTDPQVVWSTDAASPSGLAVAGDAVYLAALRGERLWQVPIDARPTGTPRDYFNGRYGRLRTVVLAPDGSLWLATSNRDGRGNPKKNDDHIYRVELR
jgi:glucose/arabinose dehydrogenase